MSETSQGRKGGGGRKPERGATTVTVGGLHRKTLYFSPEEWQAIRQRAFDEDRPYTDVVREAVRVFLKVK